MGPRASVGRSRAGEADRRGRQGDRQRVQVARARDLEAAAALERGRDRRCPQAVRASRGHPRPVVAPGRRRQDQRSDRGSHPLHAWRRGPSEVPRRGCQDGARRSRQADQALEVPPGAGAGARRPGRQDQRQPRHAQHLEAPGRGDPRQAQGHRSVGGDHEEAACRAPQADDRVARRRARASHPGGLPGRQDRRARGCGARQGRRIRRRPDARDARARDPEAREHPQGAQLPGQGLRVAGRDRAGRRAGPPRPADPAGFEAGPRCARQDHRGEEQERPVVDRRAAHVRRLVHAGGRGAGELLPGDEGVHQLQQAGRARQHGPGARAFAVRPGAVADRPGRRARRGRSRRWRRRQGVRPGAESPQARDLRRRGAPCSSCARSPTSTTST